MILENRRPSRTPPRVPRSSASLLEPIATGAWKAETASRHAEEVRAVMIAALTPEQKPLSVAVAA